MNNPVGTHSLALHTRRMRWGLLRLQKHWRRRICQRMCPPVSSLVSVRGEGWEGHTKKKPSSSAGSHAAHLQIARTMAMHTAASNMTLHNTYIQYGTCWQSTIANVRNIPLLLLPPPHQPSPALLYWTGIDPKNYLKAI